MLYTYTIQPAQPSGERFALEYNPDNTIHATCGPLHWTDVDKAIADPSQLPDWEYDNDEEGFAGHDDWGFPIVSYDPNATQEHTCSNGHAYQRIPGTVELCQVCGAPLTPR